MKLAFVCFCIFAVACFHDAILLNIYDGKDVTFCFWNVEKLFEQQYTSYCGVDSGNSSVSALQGAPFGLPCSLSMQALELFYMIEGNEADVVLSEVDTPVAVL